MSQEELPGVSCQLSAISRQPTVIQILGRCLARGELASSEAGDYWSGPVPAPLSGGRLCVMLQAEEPYIAADEKARGSRQ